MKHEDCVLQILSLFLLFLLLVVLVTLLFFISPPFPCQFISVSWGEGGGGDEMERLEL